MEMEMKKSSIKRKIVFVIHSGVLEAPAERRTHRDRRTGRVAVTLLQSQRYEQASWRKQRRERASFSAGEPRPQVASDLPPAVTQDTGGIPEKQIIPPESRFNYLPPPHPQIKKSYEGVLLTIYRCIFSFPGLQSTPYSQEQVNPSLFILQKMQASNCSLKSHYYFGVFDAKKCHSASVSTTRHRISLNKISSEWELFYSCMKVAQISFNETSGGLFWELDQKIYLGDLRDVCL